jgi:hypothetical protein
MTPYTLHFRSGPPMRVFAWSATEAVLAGFGLGDLVGWEIAP